jgi:hypothetical protein
MNYFEIEVSELKDENKLLFETFSYKEIIYLFLPCQLLFVSFEFISKSFTSL